MTDDREMQGVEDLPVKVVRGMVRNRADKGVVCPCCDQLVKVYRRPLTSAMAYAAVLLYKAAPLGEEVHVSRVLNGHGPVAAGGDFAKLGYWGLLSPGSKVGWALLTRKGRDFVECRIAVPRRAIVCKGEVLSMDTSEIVTIADVLGEKYPYDALMGRK
jgi:hypothetical protein